MHLFLILRTTLEKKSDCYILIENLIDSTSVRKWTEFL